MIDNQNPNDSYRAESGRMQQPSSRDERLQADPEMAEGPASTGRMMAYGVAILAILGVVFYGLNSGSMNPGDATKTASQSSPVTQDTTPKAPPPTNNIADSNANTKPPVAPGVRDVTPGANTEPGMTTGSSPARPQPAQSRPTGPEVDRSKSGAAD